MADFKLIRKKLGKIFRIRKRSEVQIITDALIRNQLGKNGVIRKAFEKNIEGFDPETNPIGEEEAKKILTIMLSLISNSRHFLSTDIGKSVSDGDMYEFYAKKQQAILDLSLDAITKKQNMLAAHEEYNRLNNIYLQVVSKSVKNDYHHAPNAETAEEKFYQTEKDFNQTNNADETTAKLNENTGDGI